ncbi:lactonase family protein [Gaoshiqia sp. Z1-71]|uniref:lactonase family protein n=1 Tax=Gaoshiqia hydrogeniformans TaxID=3290090 RepID=UPI003BF8D1E9
MSKLVTAVTMVLILSCSPSKKEYLLYVGTYSVENSEGIYGYHYEPLSGKLTLKNTMPNKSNPSFLEISPDGRYLYAVSEIHDFDQLDSGSVTAYRIGESGELVKINQEATLGNHPCHVAVSPDGKTVVASNYTSGSLSIYDVRNDGGLNPVKQLIRHTGSGPDSARQKGPHAHSALFTYDGSTLISADLGTDRIDLYELAGDGRSYVPAGQGPVSMAPGAGPRHFDFSPDGRFIYVMNEMASTVTVLHKDADHYHEIQTVSSLPLNYSEASYGADLHVSNDGRFVYCSNRGHNSIAVFKREQESGTIELIQHEEVQGNWPRNFVLSPDGDFLLVANQRSHNISLFAINHDTGMLSFTGKLTEVPSPVCLKFLVK